MTVEQTLSAIQSLAQNAGEMLLEHFQQPLEVAYKKDAFDPVTQADRRVDAFLRQQLREFFPGDAVLSEESPDQPPTDASRLWIVDPLDGTKDFIKGRDCFSVIIGLLEDGVPTLGCVVIPVRKQVFFAYKRLGAFCDTDGKLEQLQVSHIQSVTESTLITRHSSSELRPLEVITNQVPFKSQREEGGSGTKICLVASGAAEAHINTNSHVCKWDTLGPQVILTEAGGMITDINGQPLDYKQKELNWTQSYIASNSDVLHWEIIDWMKKLGHKQVQENTL